MTVKELTIPQDLIYNIDRVNYEQRMAINQIVFMLTHHIDDANDEFLSSELYKRLHQTLVTATAQKWCTESAVMRTLLGQMPNRYRVDVQKSKLIVEIE